MTPQWLLQLCLWLPGRFGGSRLPTQGVPQAASIQGCMLSRVVRGPGTPREEEVHLEVVETDRKEQAEVSASK